MVVADAGVNVTVHPLEYQAVRERMHALQRERDEWQDRCREAQAERDQALDLVEAVRSIALKQSSTLWSKKILAALARGAR